tara:strand:- start:328 stop:2910 length:2583 start_codon:yes stop_codon:yes gene_type:complete
MKFQLLFSLGCAVLLAGCGKKSSPAPSTGTPTQTTTAQPTAPVPRPVGEQASATPNDFTAVTAKLDAGGDLFMYWNAAQATAELDKGIGLIENQFSKLIAIDEADNGYVDEEFMAARAMARMGRSLIQEGGLGEIKGLGMSSLALEENLFRNRIYLHRDQEKTPGMLFEVLNGPEETVAAGLKFAPASTVMAHYTRADFGVAIDWIKLALIKSGIPGDVIEELSQPLGGVSPDIYQKAYFNEPITEYAKAQVGRWAVKNNVPNNDTKSEILIRPDGTFVSHFSGTGGPKQKPFELIEHGLWKLEDGISIGLVTKVDFIKGDRDEYPPLWQHMNRFKMIELEADSFVQEPMEPIWLKEQNRWEDMEPDAEDFDPSEFEANPEIPEPFEPEPKEAPNPFGDDTDPKDVDGRALEKPEEPFGDEAEFKGPVRLTYTRLAAFTSPHMAKYNNAEAFKPVDKTVPAEVVSTSPVDAVLAQYGGELGLYLTLDEQRTLPFQQGSQSMDLPRPGIVLVVKASEGIQLKNLLLPLATESPEGMLTHSTVADTVVYTLNPTEELPIKMKLAPSVFQVGDHFVLVSDLALAKEVLAVHQGTQPGLAGTAAFQRLSAGMELKGQQLQFVSPRAAEMAVGLKQLVPVLLQQSEMPEEGLSFFKSLTDELLNEEGASGHLAVLKLDAEGLMFDGRASGKGYSVAVKQSALIPVTMMASAMLGGQEVAESTPQARFATMPRTQLRELTLGLKLYLEDHGEMPDLAKWGDAILPEVGVKGVFVETGAQGSSYALNENLKGWKAEDIGPDTVLIFQSAGPFNHTGGLAEAKKEANKKETGGILVGFGDGNVRPIGAAQLDELNWSKKKMVPKSETE